MTRIRSSCVGLGVALAVLLVAACGADGLTDNASVSLRVPSRAEPRPESTEPKAKAPAAKCGPGEEVVAAVRISAVHVDGVKVPEQRLGNEVVRGFEVPPVDIPARLVPGGCIRIPTAPAGCLPSVTVSHVSIPSVTVPGYTIPGYDVDDERVPPRQVKAASARTVSTGEVGTPQVCRVDTQPGRYQPSVFRPSVFRPSAFRPSVFRPAGFRPSICAHVDDRLRCTEAVTIPAVNLPAVTLRAVTVPAATLPGRTVPEAPGTVILEGDDIVAISMPGDVLFDFDRADIRPDAAATLHVLAQELTKLAPAAPIVVEGHTDDVGTPEYNADLSARRAEAVASWLVGNAGIDPGRITTKGYGEAAPAATNDTADGRQQNRRVVVSVP